MGYMKLYLFMLKIATLSFGGAYSIWALLEKEVTIQCHENPTASPALAMPAGNTPIPTGAGHAMPVFCRREYTALFALSEVIPGPQVNAIAVFIFRSAGTGAVLVVLLAMLTPGLLLAPFLLRFYERYKQTPYVAAFFAGAVLAILTVLLLFFTQLAHAQVRAADLRAAGIATLVLAAFSGAYFFRVHPLLIVVVGGAAGYFFF